MKNLLGITLLGITLLTFSWSCEIGEACNDCLELTQKTITYTDSNGVFLLVGSGAIYDPDSMVIRTNNNEIPVWIPGGSAAISFSLDEDITTYQIFHKDTLLDTLEYELSQRKSTSCCGDVTISTRTFLNGVQIGNSDMLQIIK